MLGFIRRWFRAASTSYRATSPEDPSFPLNSPRAMNWYGGGKSAAGVAVTRDKALTLPAFLRAVTLIAGKIACVPIVTYQREGKGKRDATEHPAYELQYSSPNPAAVETTAFVWKQTMMLHTLIRGNGYTYIHRRANADPQSFELLDPDRTYPVREDGVKLYVTEAGTGTWRKLLAQNVLHWIGLGWDGLMGYDILTIASEAVGEGIAKQTYSSKFFANDARPGGVIEVPTRMDPDKAKNLVAGWNIWHAGADNAHKTGMLDNGAKFNPFQVNAEQSQLIDSRKLTNRDIANLFGLPAHKVGDDGVSAYASLENEEQSTVNDCYESWFSMIEAEHRLKLLTEAEKKNNTHTIEFLRQALVRGDLTTRTNAYRTALGGAPYMTRNEVRGLENLNPAPGGDEILDPKNMGQGGANNRPDNPADPQPGNPADNPSVKIDDQRNDPGVRAAVEETVVDAGVRVVRRMRRDALRAAKDPGKFIAWLDAFEVDQRPAVIEMLASSVQAVSALHGKPLAAEFAAADVLGAIHQALSAVADRTPAKDLERKVNHCLAQLEIELPPAFARQLMGD